MGGIGSLITGATRIGGNILRGGRGAVSSIGRGLSKVRGSAFGRGAAKLGTVLKGTAKLGVKAAFVNSLLGGSSQDLTINAGGGSTGIIPGIAGMLGSALGKATGISKIGSKLHSFLTPVSQQANGGGAGGAAGGEGGTADTNNILAKILSVLVEQSKTQNEILGHTSSTASTVSTMVEPTMVTAETLSVAAPKILDAENAIAENTDVVAAEAKAEIDERSNRLDSFDSNEFSGAIADGVVSAFGGKKGSLLSDILKWAGGLAMVGVGGTLFGGKGAQIAGKLAGAPIKTPVIDPVFAARGEALGHLNAGQFADATADTAKLVKAGVLTEKQAAKLGSRIPISKLADELGTSIPEAAQKAATAGVRVSGVSGAGVAVAKAGAKAGAKAALKSSTKGLGAIGIVADAGIHGYDAWLAQQEGDYAERNRQIAGGAGSIGGGILGGMAAGALVGAAGGAAGGPVAIVTGILGAIAGAMAGEAGMRKLTDMIQAPDTKEKVMRAKEKVVELEEGPDMKKLQNDLAEHQNRMQKEQEYYEKQVKKIENSSMSSDDKEKALAKLKHEHEIKEKQLNVQITATQKGIDAQKKEAAEAQKKLEHAVEADVWKTNWKEEQELSYHSGSGNVKKMALSEGGSMDRGLFYNDDSMWSRGEALWNGQSIRKMKNRQDVDRAWEEFLEFYEEHGHLAMEDNEIKRALDSMVSDFAHAMNKDEGKRNNFGGESAREKILWAQANERLKRKQEERERQRKQNDSLGSNRFGNGQMTELQQMFASPSSNQLEESDDSNVYSYDNSSENNEYVNLNTNNQQIQTGVAGSPESGSVYDFSSETNNPTEPDDGTLEANEAAVASSITLKNIERELKKQQETQNLIYGMLAAGGPSAGQTSDESNIRG